MKAILAIMTGLLLSLTASSQILKPVKWSYAAKKTSAKEAVVYLKATIEEGWHLYSQTVPEGGPVKTTITFSPDKSFSLVGKTVEPKPITKHEAVFNMDVSYFESSVIFQQKVKLTGAGATVKGTIEFMVCNDSQCLPPETIDFSVPVK